MKHGIYSDEWVNAATKEYSNEIEFFCPNHGDRNTVCLFQNRNIKCSSVPCRIFQLQEPLNVGEMDA